METAWVIVQLLVGVVLLAWSSDRFLHASVSLAKRWNWSPFVIGVVLVGFGTSFPELVVSFVASVRGAGQVAIGNVFGSNIANFLLVFGLSALLFPIAVKKSVWRRDFPWLIGVTVVLAVLLYSGLLSWWQGLVLVALLLIVIFFMLYRSKKEVVVVDGECVHQPIRSLAWSISWWILGLVLIALASEWLIRSAVVIAHWAGLSELVIGLTVVTLGTSLPELAATMVSAWRKQSDIALGHLVGSNIFNSTVVLAMPALFGVGRLPAAIWQRDYPWMLAVTLVVWLLLMWQARRPAFARWLAGLMVIAYVIYLYRLLV
jgi:cation:H+ antiporter